MFDRMTDLLESIADLLAELVDRPSAVFWVRIDTLIQESRKRLARRRSRRGISYSSFCDEERGGNAK